MIRVLRLIATNFAEVVILGLWMMCMKMLLNAVAVDGHTIVWAAALAGCTGVFALLLFRMGWSEAIRAHPSHAFISDHDLDKFVRIARVSAGDPNPHTNEFVVSNDFLIFLVKYTLITFTVFNHRARYEVEIPTQEQSNEPQP